MPLIPATPGIYGPFGLANRKMDAGSHWHDNFSLAALLRERPKQKCVNANNFRLTVLHPRFYKNSNKVNTDEEAITMTFIFPLPIAVLLLMYLVELENKPLQ